MKFFIAAQTYDRKVVSEIVRELEKAGHKVTEDWTARYNSERGDNGEYRHIYSNMCKAGVELCDVFILLAPVSQEPCYLLGRAAGLRKKILILGTRWADVESGNVFFYGEEYRTLDFLGDWTDAVDEKLRYVVRIIIEWLSQQKRG